MEVVLQRASSEAYWLLAPFMLFEDGVDRRFLPDSSDEHTAVLQILHTETGDRYWLYINSTTGRVTKWKFQLHGEKRLRGYVWTGYKEVDTPAGTLVFSIQKNAMGAPFAIFTENVRIPDTIPEGMFTDGMPRLYDF